MSKIFKSSRVVLDDKTFTLVSEKPQFDTVVHHGHSEDALDTIEESRIEATRIIEAAEYEANEKVKNAHKSSESIISDAYDNAKEIMTAARDEGFQEGYEKGYEEGRNEANRMIEEVIDIKNQWLSERNALFQNSEREMIDLVLHTLEEMIGYKLENDETLIESLIKKGISRITQTESLILKVSTEDYNQAVSVKPMIQSMCDKINEIDIRRDETLVNGSCVIDGDSGTVDSGIWTQFEEVRRLFLNMLQGDVHEN